MKKAKEDTEFLNDYLLYRKRQKKKDYKFIFIYFSIKGTLKRYPREREWGTNWAEGGGSKIYIVYLYD